MKSINKSQSFDIDIIYFQHLISSAEKLKSYCSSKESNYLKNDQFVRILYTSMQNFLMRESMKWLAYYSIVSGVSEDQFGADILNYRNHYCSNNISFISRKFLLSEWIRIYQSIKSKGEVVDFNYNKYFDKKYLFDFSLPKSFTAYKKLSLEVFKRACSWDSNIHKVQNLNSFFASPILMVIFSEKLKGIKFIKTGPYAGKYIESNDGIFLKCQNLICRNVNRTKFINSLPIVDKKDYPKYIDDLSCLVNKKYKISASDQLLEAFFLSKYTNIPDILMLTTNVKLQSKLLDSSLNNAIDNWATKNIQFLSNDLLIEESLTYDLVEQKLFFKNDTANFAVHIDVNAGELDKINQMKGKITITKEIKINLKIIKWLREQSFKRNIDNPIKQKALRIRRLSLIIENEFKSVYNDLKYPPPIEVLSKLIAKDLYQQFVTYHGGFFKKSSTKGIVIPVQFHYGPFALRYLGQIN